jgi:hypothetical protein
MNLPPTKFLLKYGKHPESHCCKLKPKNVIAIEEREKPAYRQAGNLIDFLIDCHASFVTTLLEKALSLQQCPESPTLKWDMNINKKTIIL